MIHFVDCGKSIAAESFQWKGFAEALGNSINNGAFFQNLTGTIEKRSLKRKVLEIAREDNCFWFGPPLYPLRVLNLPSLLTKPRTHTHNAVEGIQVILAW